MKIGQMLGLGGNPLYQFLDSNRNAVSSALMGAGAAGGEGILGMAAHTQKGSELDDLVAEKKAAEAERQQAIAEAAKQKNFTLRALAKFPDLAAAAEAGVPVTTLYQEAWKRSQPQAGQQPTAAIQEYTFAKENGFTGSFADWMQTGRNGAAGPQIGLQPQWGMGPDGKPVLGQMSSDGRFVPTEMPEGVSPMDPRLLNSERSGGTLAGKIESQAAIDLPGAIAKGEYAIQQLDGLLSTVKDPATGNMVPNVEFQDQFGTDSLGLGIPMGQMLPALPNTPKAGFQARLSQVEGQAFLQAFESLKGGGAISEVEGMKAQQAIMRAQTSQTPQAFEAAIKEAGDIYAAGIQRAKDMVTLGVQGRAELSLGAPASGGVTDLGNGITIREIP